MVRFVIASIEQLGLGYIKGCVHTLFNFFMMPHMNVSVFLLNVYN